MLYIFDWDGTLVDSTPKIIRCMSAASVEIGLPLLAEERYSHIIGLGLPEGVQHLYPGADEATHTLLRETYSRLFVADEHKPDFFENVEQHLASLKSAGHKLAVATGKARKGLNRQFDEKNMHGYFDASRCADETRSKPHPLMLNELMAELDAAPSECVMVGDTSFDLEMAANAGMRSVGVSYGAHAVERLFPHKPLVVADHFDQVFETLLAAASVNV